MAYLFVNIIFPSLSCGLVKLKNALEVLVRIFTSIFIESILLLEIYPHTGLYYRQYYIFIYLRFLFISVKLSARRICVETVHVTFHSLTIRMLHNPT